MVITEVKFLVKINSNGVEEWNYTYGAGGYSDGFSVKQTTDGGYIITGTKHQVEMRKIFI